MRELKEPGAHWISDQDVEKALDFLRDKAVEIANAKAEKIKAEHMLKAVKALVMSEHATLPVGAQEREAYASKQYRDAVFEIGKTTREYELLHALRVAAEAKIETWRTMNANWTAMKL